MSAALMTLATFWVSAEISTMPMLAPTDNVLAPHTKRKSRIAWRTPSAMRAACSSVQPSRRSPYPRLQETCDIAQQTVAGRVATGVVDELELAEVDVQQRVRALTSLRRE